MPQLAHLARIIAVLTLALLSVMPARAVEPDEVLPDAQLEARARRISSELRCLVCQNQSIDDSSAPLARDLRLLVRERLKAGDSDGDARAFIVARYGDFVLLKPPFSVSTVLLWITPLLLLGATGWIVVSRLSSARASPSVQESQPLTTDERRRLDELLGKR